MTLLRPVLTMRQHKAMGFSLYMESVVDCTIVMRYVTVCHMYLQEGLLLSYLLLCHDYVKHITLERHNCSSFQTSLKSFAWYCLLFILPFEEFCVVLSSPSTFLLQELEKQSNESLTVFACSKY